MIPGIGGSEIGPLAVLLGVAAAFGLVARFLFFTAYRDRPQLRVRRSASIVACAGGLVMAAAGMFLPYQGTTGDRCPSALPSQGFRTDSLAKWHSDDPRATAGQVLVIFGWATPVLMLMVLGVRLDAKDSD